MLNYIEFENRGMKHAELAGIKNIIFDLGGVIIDIYYDKTIESFKKLGFSDFDSIYSQIKHTRVFDLLEIGKLPSQAFRMELRKFRNNLSDKQIDEAWSAMIGEMPESYIALLGSLKGKYRTFLLSNTNAIHIDYLIKRMVKKFGYNPLPNMFEYLYLSHEMGCRKPDMEAYEYVLRDAAINPGETLFIDDLEVNIKGAKKVGLHTFHLVDTKLSSLFNMNPAAIIS